MTALRLDSAPLIRLFGKYGAEAPQMYWEPLGKINAIIMGSSEVFTEVMRIIDRQEALLERNKPLSNEMSMGKLYFPATRLIDDVQFGLLFPGILGGLTIANNRMLRLSRANSSSFYRVIFTVVLILRLLRRVRGRRI